MPYSGCSALHGGNPHLKKYLSISFAVRKKYSKSQVPLSYEDIIVTLKIIINTYL